MTPSPRVRRAALIGRVRPPAPLDALVEAAEWLEAHGCEPTVEVECARVAGVDTRWPTATRDRLAHDADVVLAFGGDGTLLDAARAVVHSESDAPLMGVNLGRLGFLTEVARAEMKDAFAQLLAGDVRIETRVMLEGRIDSGAAGAIAERLALNDIVVTRGSLSRMIEMTVEVDGQFVCHVKADGLIVATATGSTAYNLSAGGPIVHPSVDAVVLTPIAPHTLTQRPLVLPASALVEIRPLLESGSEGIVTFDGQYGLPLAADTLVRIARAPRELRLIHTLPRTHFDVLREKLKWGNS